MKLPTQSRTTKACPEKERYLVVDTMPPAEGVKNALPIPDRLPIYNRAYPMKFLMAVLNESAEEVACQRILNEFKDSGGKERYRY